MPTKVIDKSDEIRFTKMHGIGNDYIYINCLEKMPADLPQLAVEMSDRHFGVGGDGIVINLETLSGIKVLSLNLDTDNEVESVTVDMGEPILNPSKIPADFPGEMMVEQKIHTTHGDMVVTAVSMGNPHCVVFTSGIDDLDLEKTGPLFEDHEMFPDRINTEFVEVIDGHTIRMRVWERGSGETISCGTGTCAAVVAAVLNGYCRRGEEIEVQIRGGKLYDTYMENGEVFMRGPAVTVFDGELI